MARSRSETASSGAGAVVNGGLTRPVGRRRRVLSCRAVSSARPALVRPKRSESRNGRRSSARAARARRCQPCHSPEQGASQHDGSKAAIPINRESLLHCYPDSRARTESNSRFSPPTPRGSGPRNLCSIRSKPPGAPPVSLSPGLPGSSSPAVAVARRPRSGGNEESQSLQCDAFKSRSNM